MAEQLFDVMTLARIWLKRYSVFEPEMKIGVASIFFAFHYR